MFIHSEVTFLLVIINLVYPPPGQTDISQILIRVDWEFMFKEQSV